MNIEEVMAMFAFTQGRTLLAYISQPNGYLWWAGYPCTVKPGINVDQEKSEFPVLSIVSADNPEADYYANFPVKSAEVSEGQLILTGPNGIARFVVVDNGK